MLLFAIITWIMSLTTVMTLWGVLTVNEKCRVVAIVPAKMVLKS